MTIVGGPSAADGRESGSNDIHDTIGQRFANCPLLDVMKTIKNMFIFTVTTRKMVLLVLP